MTSILLLICGMAIFFGINIINHHPLRISIAKKVGEQNYLIVFSAIAIIGISLISIGYTFATQIITDVGMAWQPFNVPIFISYAVLWFSCALLVAQPLGPNIINTNIRHPFISGIALGAGYHLLIDGQFFSSMVFSAFLMYCIWHRQTRPYLLFLEAKSKWKWNIFLIALATAIFFGGLHLH